MILNLHDHTHKQLCFVYLDSILGIGLAVGGNHAPVSIRALKDASGQMHQRFGYFLFLCEQTAHHKGTP